MHDLMGTTYYLSGRASDKLFGKGSNLTVGSSGNTVDVVYNF